MFGLCFVVLATVFAQNVCCVAKGCDVVLPRPGVYNVLFVLAMGRDHLYSVGPTVLG